MGFATSGVASKSIISGLEVVGFAAPSGVVPDVEDPIFMGGGGLQFVDPSVFMLGRVILKLSSATVGCTELWELAAGIPICGLCHVGP